MLVSRAVPSFALDFTHAVRLLVRRPGFSLLAIATLAIGIGVNVVAFSAVNALLLRPLDYPGADRLAWFFESRTSGTYGSVSLPVVEAAAARGRAIDGIAAETRLPLAWTHERVTDQVWAQVVTANYFDLLGTAPHAGRFFVDADRSATTPAVVVSERFWTTTLLQQAFSPRTLTLNEVEHAVIGVVDDGFKGPGGLFAPDVWVLVDQRHALRLPAELEHAASPAFTAVVRLREGVEAGAAAADLTLVAEAAAPLEPDDRRPDGVRARVVPFGDGHPETREIARIAWVAMATVGLVLLLACFNVASLLMARAVERQREIAIRAAIGASRLQILKQLAVEGLVFASLSGAAALAVAYWSEQLLSTFSLPAPIPQRLDLSPDWRTAVFTMALVVAGGLVPALWPAWQATRRLDGRDLGSGVVGGGPAGHTRARRGLVMMQVAGSTAFLGAALLFAHSFTAARQHDPGMDLDRTLVVEVSPHAHGYDRARAQQAVDAFVDRLSQAPGIETAGLGDRVPFYVGFPQTLALERPEQPCHDAACGHIQSYAAGPRYFAAQDIAVVAGREFEQADAGRTDLVILNRALAARLFGAENPVGAWVREGRDDAARMRQVVGVVADVTQRSPTEPPTAAAYVPLTDDDYASTLTIVARTASDAGRAAPLAREILGAVAPGVPPGAIHPMRERLRVPMWPLRTATGLFLTCALLALTLAVCGLFGVTYFSVRQRLREFGVRTALGASRGQVMRLVLGEGVRVAAPGIVLGLVAAMGVARALSRMLVATSPTDVPTLAITLLVQAAVTLAACALPAWQASRVDPLVVLREG